MVEEFGSLRPSVVRQDNVPEMVERVARTLCRAKWDRKKWYGACSKEARLDWCENKYWPEFVTDARAAIEAMREPTEAMVAAPDHESDYCDAQYLQDEDFAGAWDAMIDAALSGKGSGGGERSSSETNPKPLGV